MKTYTVREAALILNLSPRTVQKWCARGHSNANGIRFHGTSYILTQVGVDWIRTQNHRPGNPDIANMWNRSTNH